jgi:hypothetical protein
MQKAKDYHSYFHENGFLKECPHTDTKLQEIWNLRQWDILKLRTKTVFDFTNDPKILQAIEIDQTKEEYLQDLTELKRAFGLIDYAEYIKDTQLIKVVGKEFEKEFSEFFNE